MIRFWVRESMGWILVLMGLGIFYLCIALLLNPGPEFIFEAPFLTAIGIIVFRGGIHLLKVAVAARISMNTQAVPLKTQAVERRPRKTEAPLDW